MLKIQPVSYNFSKIDNKLRTDDPKKSEADDGDANKKYKNNFVLNDAIDIALNKMAKDKNEDKSKKIPEGF